MAALPAAGLLAWLAAAPASALDRPAGLIRQWQEADATCSDPGRPPEAIAAACGWQREVAGRLQRAAWCLGREGELSYLYSWHRCGAASYNADGSAYVVTLGALR